MKHKLCLIPYVDLHDAVLMWTDDSFLITSDIDDDDSAMSKACELIESMYNFQNDERTKKHFRYVGEIEHNDTAYSVISYLVPLNYMGKFNKRPRVRFDFLTKEFQIIESSFKVNDSFALAVGLKLLAFF